MKKASFASTAGARARENRRDAIIDGTLKKQFQLREHFFARLASRSSLADLKPQEQRALVKLVERASPGFFRGLGRIVSFKSRSWSRNSGAEKAWNGTTATPSAWGIIWAVHPWAWQYINGLLDGKPVSLQPLYKTQDFTLTLLPGTGRQFRAVAAPQWKDSPGTGELLDALLMSLRANPFPYRRCSFCKKTVFIPIKRQKYCPGCKGKASEKSRDKEARRAYMRQLMKDRRQLRCLNKRAKKKPGNRSGTRSVKRLEKR